MGQGGGWAAERVVNTAGRPPRQRAGPGGRPPAGPPSSRVRGARLPSTSPSTSTSPRPRPRLTLHHVLRHLREELGQHALPGGHERARVQRRLAALPRLLKRVRVRAVLGKGARRLDAALHLAKDALPPQRRQRQAGQRLGLQLQHAHRGAHDEPRQALEHAHRQAKAAARLPALRSPRPRQGEGVGRDGVGVGGGALGARRLLLRRARTGRHRHPHRRRCTQTHGPGHAPSHKQGAPRGPAQSRGAARTAMGSSSRPEPAPVKP